MDDNWCLGTVCALSQRGLRGFEQNFGFQLSPSCLKATLPVGKRNLCVRLIQAEGKTKVNHCFDFAFWHGLELSPAISEWHCCHLYVAGLTH